MSSGRPNATTDAHPALIRIGRFVAVTVAGLGLATGVLGQADPFYASRLTEGTLAYERGDHHQATISLEIACFGLLDHPPLLAECLVRLAMAQSADDDDKGFEATFGRLVEAESLTAAYSEAVLDPVLRSEFEAVVGRRVAGAALRDFAPLSHLVTSRQAARFDGMSPRRQRQEIERLRTSDPMNVQWPLALARLEHDEDRPNDCLEAADAVLALQPQHPDGTCLAGWALGRLDRCVAALDRLDDCDWSTAIDYGVTLLACQVENEDWSAARAVVDAMPSAWLDVTQVRRLASVVEAAAEPDAPLEVAEEAVPAEPEAGGGLAEMDVENESEMPEPASGEGEPDREAEMSSTVLSESELARLAEADAAVAAARSAAELSRAYDLVASVADAHPDRGDLHYQAAEIAYRASRWPEAVRHFDAAGDPGDEEPQLLFYYAVALYESGRTAKAAEMLERCVDDLRRTPFVNAYVTKILTPGAGA